MIEFSEILTSFSHVIWPIFRIGGLLLSVPIFSSAVVPQTVRALFVLVLSFLASGYIDPNLSFESFSVSHVLYVIEEIFLGVIMGFILQIVFQAFIIGGQIIAMQMGLGFATMVDPSSNANVPLISQFYLTLVTLVFLSLNGHLLILDMVITSFKTLPIGSIKFDTTMLWSAIEFSVWMFKSAIMIALPAIISLLVVNLSFGIMTRVAPQLNLFSIGFPITLTLGVIIIFITLYGVLPHISTTLNHGIKYIQGVIG